MKEKIWMERKAQNYTLEYKKWLFRLDVTDGWNYFVSVHYDGKTWFYLNTGVKTIEEAKERVENFIKTELK